ncbi:MAG: hypothetical protein OXD37_09465 [Acidimicrobiaceae bacterium]|nr:hypothetical protein [Acidimicrobiaceae bacterium]
MTAASPQASPLRRRRTALQRITERRGSAHGSSSRRRDGAHSPGIATIEWLLILAAVAGFAAVSAVAFQRILNSVVDQPVDPSVRVLQAEARAAEIEAEGRRGTPNQDAVLMQRCAAIAQEFPDVIKSATWEESDNKKCNLMLRQSP